MAYDAKDKNGDCIFCKISNKEFPPLWWGLIREDEKFMAWLSPFPNTEWFSIVIPKKHYGSDCLMMPDQDLQDFILAAKHVSTLLMKAMPDVWRIGLMMEWTGIDHAHIKLSPMHWTQWMRTWEWKQVLSEANDYFEQYPWYMMSNDWPRVDDEKLQALAEKIRNCE